MNIPIPNVVSQLRTPYASTDDTCATAGNMCEANINRNTVLSYPQITKKEFALDFTPPTYGVGTGYASRPVRDTLDVNEAFVNPFGMGPIDDISDQGMSEEQALAQIRINSAPGATQDDPTERLLDPAATLSNSKVVFENFEHSSAASHYNPMLLFLIAIGLGGMVFYANRK